MTTQPNIPSIEKLREHLSDFQYAEFSWPGEKKKPLEVDIQTINAVLTLYDAADKSRDPDKMRTAIEDKIARDRVHFFSIVDIAWKAVGINI